MAVVCSSLAALLAMACSEPALSVAANPSPVSASSIPSTLNPIFSKQAAILGAPSRLQQIAMQQSGQSPAAQATVQQASLVPAAGGALYPARPAILGHYPPAGAGYGWTPASPDRPDIFGTTAMPVARTSLDAKWRRVTASFSSAVPLSRQVPVGDQANGQLAKVALVNSWVNRHISFVSDIRSSGQADRWSGAAETLGRGQGDCEDYAITKLQLLKALGFSADDLYLSVVRDLVRRADHAVLVVRVEGRFFVLDNNVDRVLDTQEVADYRPVVTYAASGKAWLHGYRQTPVIQLASADRAAIAPAASR
jgi:predicted transglutaminase-like cysteine proteinase